jgi:hypothetical protein
MPFYRLYRYLYKLAARIHVARLGWGVLIRTGWLCSLELISYTVLAK